MSSPNWNFGFGIDMLDGPVIKPFGHREPSRKSKVGVIDRGLYSNAREFETAFSRWISESSAPLAKR